MDLDMASSIRINHPIANGIQEVDGSIPFGSTKQEDFELAVGRAAFPFFCANSTIGIYSVPLLFEMSLCFSLGVVPANS